MGQTTCRKAHPGTSAPQPRTANPAAGVLHRALQARSGRPV